jgi:hypothetical protein
MSRRLPDSSMQRYALLGFVLVLLVGPACASEPPSDSRSPSATDVCSKLDGLLSEIEAKSGSELQHDQGTITKLVDALVASSLALDRTGDHSFRDQAQLLKAGWHGQDAQSFNEAMNEYLAVCEIPVAGQV